MGRTDKMKKIVIHGASGLKNSGDEAILQAILRQCSDDWQVSVISLDQEYTRKLHPGVCVLQMGTRDCKRAIDECDALILGGGGLLQDETSVYNVGRWLTYVRYAIRKKKKVFLYANSIGPIRFGINRLMVKKALRKVSRITLRDEISAQELKELGITENTVVTADPVFSLDIDENVPCSGHLPFDEAQEYIVVCMRHWFDTNMWIPVSICSRLGIRSRRNRKLYADYIRELAAFARKVQQSGRRIIFLPFLYGRDSAVAADICRAAQMGGECIIETGDMRPEEIIGIIQGAQAVIGMRLHSIIYAVLTGTPVVPMEYSLKVRGLVRYLGLEEYSVDMETFSHEILWEHTQQILEQRENVCRKLRQCRDEMKDREARNMMLLKEMLEQNGNAVE